MKSTDRISQWLVQDGRKLAAITDLLNQLCRHLVARNSRASPYRIIEDLAGLGFTDYCVLPIDFNASPDRRHHI